MRKCSGIFRSGDLGFKRDLSDPLEHLNQRGEKSSTGYTIRK